MNQPFEVFFNEESTMRPVTNDGAGAERQYAFAVGDMTDLIASYGADKVMVDVFNQYPGIYAALCQHFYRDFYKIPSENPETDRVIHIQ
jgi:hypothetical protein